MTFFETYFPFCTVENGRRMGTYYEQMTFNSSAKDIFFSVLKNEARIQSVLIEFW